MLIFKLIPKLFTTNNLDWLKNVPENTLSAVMVHKWIAMLPNVGQYSRWLDSYAFEIPAKHFTALAWSILPKSHKAPFGRYIKKVEDEEAMQIIIDKIRKQLELSDNDYTENKKYILKYIADNKLQLFKDFGIAKKHWKKHDLDFKEMKSGGKQEGKKGLDMWF